MSYCLNLKMQRHNTAKNAINTSILEAFYEKKIITTVES